MNAATLDLTQLADDLAYASGMGIEQATHELIVEGASEVQALGRQYAPRRTGALANSITASFPDPLHAVIGPSAYYGVYQEFGTEGPYTIRPHKPGGVLVFYVNGKKVVARQVTHPGLRARPYMRPAAAQTEDDLAAKVANAGAALAMGQR